MGMSSSVIQTAGEVLVILALLYGLLQIVPKISEIELFPKWWVIKTKCSSLKHFPPLMMTWLLDSVVKQFPLLHTLPLAGRQKAINAYIPSLYIGGLLVALLQCNSSRLMTLLILLCWWQPCACYWGLMLTYCRVPAFEDRFQGICVRIAHTEQLLWKAVSVALEMRVSRPWKVCLCPCKSLQGMLLSLSRPLQVCYIIIYCGPWHLL